MGNNYVLKTGLVSLGLLGISLGAGAQVVSPDSIQRLAPPKVLLKVGLSLTHFSYSSGGQNQTWRLVVPLSVGAEYRLSPRLAMYAQADADLQASRAVTRRRSGQANALPSAAVGLGMRYYYNQPGKGQPARGHSLYGSYLALEGSIERTEITAKYLTTNLSRRQTPTSLTPGVYAYWGTQHRLRRAMLYDVNAGVGLQAPPYYNYESITPTRYNLTAQVNLRLYWGWGF